MDLSSLFGGFGGSPYVDPGMSMTPPPSPGLAPPPGLLGKLEQATAPYGGLMNLGLQLMANSGPSPVKQNMGSILGKSMLQSRESAMQNQMQQLQIAQAQMQVGQMAARNKLISTMYGGGQPQGQPPGAPPMQGGPQGMPLPRPPQGAPPQPPAPQGGGLMGAPGGAPPQMPSAPAPQGGPDINAEPIAGMSPDMYRQLGLLSGKDALETEKEIRGLQLQGVQQRATPQVEMLDTLIKSDSPTQYIKARPALLQAWQQIAPSLGLDPVKDFTDAKARVAFSFARNQVAGAAQLPFDAPTLAVQTKAGPLGSIYQTDPLSGKTNQVKGEEDLKQVIGANGQPVNVRASAAEGKSPFNATIYGSTNIDEQTKDLAYQFAKANGGKLPPFLNGRSDAFKGQMANYIAKRAAAEGDTATSMIAQGQATQSAQKVVTSFTSGKDKDTLLGINTAVQHMDLLKPLIDALGTGDLKKVNQLGNWFKNQTGVAAPTDYAAIKEFVGGEVAKAVLPGGGGETERRALMAPLDDANSPSAIKSAVIRVQEALAGKTNAMRNDWDVGTNGTQGAFDKFLLPATKKALGIDTASSSSGGGASVTQAQVQDYATKHGLSLDQATAHVKANGFTVQ